MAHATGAGARFVRFGGYGFIAVVKAEDSQLHRPCDGFRRVAGASIRNSSPPACPRSG